VGILVGTPAMGRDFDIFQIAHMNRLIWVAAAADLQAARVRVEKLMKTYPADYLIFSQKCGVQVRVKYERR
jgi:hypothetical protein